MMSNFDVFEVQVSVQTDRGYRANIHRCVIAQDLSQALREARDSIEGNDLRVHQVIRRASQVMVPKDVVEIIGRYSSYAPPTQYQVGASELIQ